MSKNTLTDNNAYGSIIYNGEMYSISCVVKDNRDKENRFKLPTRPEFELSDVIMVQVTNNR